MANEKIMNTRIQLKYDSYEKWNSSSVVLKAGEIAIAHLGPANKDGSTHTSGQHPVLIKVGDNAHTFAELPWLSALAADVYAWAKKENPDWNDFPALPIEVIDNGTGKFVTDVEYANNKITISRDDAVNTLKVTDDDIVIGSVDKEKGDVTLDLKHKEYGKAGSTTDASSDATAAGTSVTIKVPSLTVDEYGHTEFNGETSHTITIPGEVAVGDGNITISAGTGLTDGGSFNVNQDTDSTITLNHQAKPTTGTAEQATAGEGRTYVTEVLVDALGHIAGVKTATETVTNTAHTHSDGVGVKVTGAGGIDGDVKIDLDIKFNTSLVEKDSKKYLQILDATDDSLITEFDATEFVKDGMLESVVANQTNNTLTFTWNTDGGKTVTTVNLSEIADIYTGVDGTTVKVDVSSDNKISAEVKTGTLKDGHIASDAAIAETKLAQGVQDALALARTALQSVEHPDYTDEFAGKKNVQTAIENKITKAAHVLTSLTQNTNGDIAYEVKELTPADIGAAPADDYALKSELPVVNDGKFTVSGTGSLTGSGEMTANQAGDTTATLDIVAKGVTTEKIADQAVGAEQTKAFRKEDKTSEEVWVFYCGTASELV